MLITNTGWSATLLATSLVLILIGFVERSCLCIEHTDKLSVEQKPSVYWKDLKETLAVNSDIKHSHTDKTLS